MYLTFNRDDKFLEEEFYHLSFPYLKLFVLKILKQKTKFACSKCDMLIVDLNGRSKQLNKYQFRYIFHAGNKQ